jgi:hypothetical protein
MYCTAEGVSVGPILFAEDNLSPKTKLQEIEQLDPLLAVFDHYTGVSGLNINVKKSCALYINSSPELIYSMTTAQKLHYP